MPRARIFYGWWVSSRSPRWSSSPPACASRCGRSSNRWWPISASIARVTRWRSRCVTIVGTIILTASAFATGLVHSLWQFYLTWGVLMALGLAATGPVVASAVVSRWFTRRRATALGLLGGASMAGMSMLVPVAMWLILTLGWRLTFGVIALALFVVMMPLAVWVVRDSPEAMGLGPDGTVPAAAAAPSAAGERASVGEAMQTHAFWQMAGGLSTCGFTMSLLSSHGRPDADRPRRHADARVVGHGGARGEQRRLHAPPGRAGRPRRLPARAGVDLRRSRARDPGALHDPPDAAGAVRYRRRRGGVPWAARSR